MSTDTCPTADETIAAVTNDAVASQESTKTEKVAAPAAGACPNCNSTEPWGSASWCPACGFYPAIGQCVATDKEATYEVKETPLSELVPPWAQVLAFGVVAIFVISLTARMAVLEDDSHRLYWSLVQCGCGLIALAVGHTAVFMYAIVRTDQFAPFDVVMKPIAVWKPALTALPDKPWRVWAGGWGLTAAICALTVIGGIRYSAIFEDWGFEKRAQASLMHAVVEQARQEREGGADSLEDAMKDFTGEAGVDEEESLEGFARTDCLIFGYTSFADDGISELLLATIIEGELKFAGRVSFNDMPVDVQEKLRQRFPEIERLRSFVDTPLAGHWLEPVLMCHVAYRGWSKEGMMLHPRFLRLLAEADLR